LNDNESYKKLYNKLLPWAIWLTRDRDIAEELMQETFLEIMRCKLADRYDPRRGANPLTYFNNVLRKTWQDMLKSRSSIKRGGRVYTFSLDRKLEHHETDLTEEQREQARIALSLGTPKMQRVVAQFQYGRGMSQGEVSRALGKPLGTIKSTSSRYLDKVRGYMTKNQNR
jgi:RNA polymerase sigma factor (sigma-70 family)